MSDQKGKIFAPRDLGRMAYAEALEVQLAVHAQVVSGEAPPTLLFVEHDPVITISRRKDAAAHLLASARELERMGIQVQPTDRGGDITYHGPGQLVVYPIVPLAQLRCNVSQYMRLLESVVIACLENWRLQGQRIEGRTGVWVDAAGGPAKLCAMGIRVRRGVTLHGLALNVATDLSHFGAIVPCGIADAGVTSLAALLGSAAPTMASVKLAMIEAFDQVCSVRLGDAAASRE